MVAGYWQALNPVQRAFMRCQKEKQNPENYEPQVLSTKLDDKIEICQGQWGWYFTANIE
jgi:hypothetical protein